MTFPKWLFGSGRPTNAQIRQAVAHDTWVVYCALNASRRTEGMWFGFDTWWDTSGDSWLHKPQSWLPELTRNDLRDWLRRFAKANPTGNVGAICDALAAEVGAPAMSGAVLAPGESKQFTVVLK